jgi:hypothetical protein
MHQSPLPKAEMITGKIAGDYEMQAKTGLRPCGILKCETDHRHGYVIRLPDDSLSYVGRECGKTLFGRDWVQQRRDYTRTKNEQARVAALAELRDELRARISSGVEPETDQLKWARAALAAFDSLFVPLRDTLRNRADQGDTAVLIPRLETEREVRERKFRASDETRNITPRKILALVGRLQGLPGIRSSSRVDRVLDVQIPTALNSARAVVDDLAASPDEIQAVMRRLDAARRDVEPAIRHLRAFVERDNLKLLPHLLAAQTAGIATVEFQTSAPVAFVIRYR